MYAKEYPFSFGEKNFKYELEKKTILIAIPALMMEQIKSIYRMCLDDLNNSRPTQDDDYYAEHMYYENEMRQDLENLKSKSPSGNIEEKYEFLYEDASSLLIRLEEVCGNALFSKHIRDVSEFIFKHILPQFDNPVIIK